jgi:hypothetical protein
VDDETHAPFLPAPSATRRGITLEQRSPVGSATGVCSVDGGNTDGLARKVYDAANAACDEQATATATAKRAIAERPNQRLITHLRVG